jgi:organic hydroperoxide reductase OsmC/OhrA
MGIACRNGQHTRRFQEIAEATKKGCPVSQALETVPIELTATVVG